MIASVTRRRFLVEDYERMVTAGILTEDDRVELIAGEIVEMSPIGGRHMGRVNVLTALLSRVVMQEALISVQNPIRLSTDGEPQPDIALLRHDASLDTVPTPDDVLLVIEVADSSRDYDRQVKLPLYAAAGIREAWLVDLVDEVIERHTDPRDGIYRRVARAGRGESLTSTVLPAITLSVDAIIG
jgi:Uma2 family endonuclease